ncbi:gp02 Rz1 [Burkholderia phage BcepB1A]|uniref:gp02 Rz1 n=1 Tax=Burkholderia phage BcepB1A TaxID=279530 RepID=UPI00003779B9|nr:gp02 Rz1 [Burkholderia phage BcepB1A]AAT37766.1 gp02 Rz1 [Burkholderia phage BcepB1A]
MKQIVSKLASTAVVVAVSACGSLPSQPDRTLQVQQCPQPSPSILQDSPDLIQLLDQLISPFDAASTK